jgi:hypothetical protein
VPISANHVNFFISCAVAFIAFALIARWYVWPAIRDRASKRLYEKTPFDSVRDFQPIATIAVMPFLLIVGPQNKVATLKDFIAHARANPDKVTYGSPSRTMRSTSKFERTPWASGSAVIVRPGPSARA